MLKIQKADTSDFRVDQRELQTMRDIRKELLTMQRKLDYPYMSCVCQATRITREQNRIAKSIQSALSATEKLIIHYIDRETII